METTGQRSSMSREAMKQALDYRTRYDRGCYKCGSHYCPADCPDPTHLVPQQPLCTSPPKTEQEPVAWMHTTGTGHRYFRKKPQDKVFNPQPVFTAPQKKPWVELTDEEIYATYDEAVSLVNAAWANDFGTVSLMFPIAFYELLEAKLKEQNHGQP